MFDGERHRNYITELALASQTLEEFNRALFEYLKPIIGFDTACASWTRANRCDSPQVFCVGYDAAQLQAHFSRYMNELTPSELARFASSRVTTDTDVIGPARRLSLAVYRELLIPYGVSSCLTRVWLCRAGALAIHIGRTGRGAGLWGRPIQRLQALLPAIRLGMALLASDELMRSSGATNEWWAAAWNLSERERDAVRLVARGFRNPEIAHMLRVSPNTVRNHLAHIFRKAEVSTRAELLFAMNDEAIDGAGMLASGRSDSRPWCDYVESGLSGKEPL